MLHKPNTSVVNRPVRLAGGAILEIADGLACSRCDTKVRGIDAELLEAGIRLICRSCHRQIFSFEPTR